MSLIEKKFKLKKKILKQNLKLKNKISEDINFGLIYSLNLKIINEVEKIDMILNYLYNESLYDNKHFKYDNLIFFLIKNYYVKEFKLKVIEILNNINDTKNNFFYAKLIINYDNFLMDLLNFENEEDIINLYKINWYFNIFNIKYSKIYQNDYNNEIIINFITKINNFDEKMYNYFFSITRNFIHHNLDRNKNLFLFNYFISIYPNFFEKDKFEVLNIIKLIIKKFHKNENIIEIENTFQIIDNDINLKEDLFNININSNMILESTIILNFYIKYKFCFKDCDYINRINNFLFNSEYDRNDDLFVNILKMVYYYLKINYENFNENKLFDILSKCYEIFYKLIYNYEILLYLTKIFVLLIDNKFEKIKNYFENFFYKIVEYYDHINNLEILESFNLKIKIINNLITILRCLYEYSPDKFTLIINENKNKIDKIISVQFKLEYDNKYINKLNNNIKELEDIFDYIN